MTIKSLGLSFVKNYLRAVVGLLLWLKKPDIIAVTGTAGKTTAKETIYAVLAQKFGRNVSRTHGSLSTKTGVPIGLLGFKPDWEKLGPSIWAWPWWLIKASAQAIIFMLGLKKYPQLWVVEFAADKPGDFDFLLTYIKPQIGVITNVGIGHASFFGSQEGVAREKGKLVSVLPQEGFAVLNANDELVKKMADATSAKVQWVRAKGLNFAPAAARIIGRLYNMTYQQIEKGLAKVKLPAGRLDILSGRNGVVIIDASYNANPISMQAALDVLNQYPRKSVRDHRKVALLGEMLELGRQSQPAHKEIYHRARLVADEIFAVGSGFQGIAKNHFKDIDEALQGFLPQVKPGDIILVKGSHGVGLKKLVKELVL